MKQIQWIFQKNAKQYEWYIFRNDLTIDVLDEIWADISALSRYILYINDKLVSRGPVRSYDFAKHYDSIDITPFMKPGKNSIVILSQFVHAGGVYACIRNHTFVLCETDKHWKTKRYLALDASSEACAPPLEPVCLNEEIFDARIDADVLSSSYNFQSWENAVFVHPEYCHILPYKGGLCAQTTVHPVTFMGAAAIAVQNDFVFRLKNPGRQLNKVRKCAGELYVFTLYSDTARTVDFLAGNILQCSLNGKSITDRAHLRAGTNFFAAYYYDSRSDPYFVFHDTDALPFVEIPYQNASIQAGVFNLKPDDVFFSWTYPDENRYKDSDGNEMIAAILGCTCAEDLSCYFAKLTPAQVCTPSVSCIMENTKYGTIPQAACDPSLQLHPDFAADDHSVLNPVHMLNANAEYTTVSGDTALFFDFGTERLGYIDLCICASAGTIIETMGFEVIDFNGMHYMPLNCMRYLCRDGWQQYTAVNPRGMRYLCVMIKHAENPVKIKHIALESCIAMTEEAGSFMCDDQMLNNIYDMCINTVRLCMSDTYLDCPGYEQVYWLNDARITAMANLLNLGAFDFDFRCLSLIGQSLTEDYKTFYRSDKAYQENKYLVAGAFSSYVYGGFPIGAFHWGLQIYDYYLHSADIEGTKQLFPLLQKMLANCDNMMSSRGLFAMEGAWNLIEWAQNDVFPCGELTVNSALLAQLYYVTSLMAEDFGDTAYAALCREKSAAIKDAINAYCWNDTIGGYVDTVRDAYGYDLYVRFFQKNGMEYVDFATFQSYTRISQHTNIIAYCCNCIREDRKAQVKTYALDILRDDYKTLHSQPNDNILRTDRRIDDIVTMGSPFLLFYLFRFLSDLGEHESILKLIRRTYHYMIECGTNTCWETFYNPGADIWTRSICHGWGSSPAICLQTEICGIKPLKPGYREFSFRPHLAGLKKIKTSIPTPYGKIFVQIDTENGICKLDHPKECKLIP